MECFSHHFPREQICAEFNFLYNKIDVCKVKKPILATSLWHILGDVLSRSECLLSDGVHSPEASAGAQPLQKVGDVCLCLNEVAFILSESILRTTADEF